MSFLLRFLAILFMYTSTTCAMAQVQNIQPQDTVNAFYNSLLQYSQNELGNEVFTEKISSYIAVPYVLRFLLGYIPIPKKETVELQNAVVQNILQIYNSKISKLENDKINILNTTLSKKYASVFTTITDDSGPIKVEWRLVNQDDNQNWKIFDVAIENISFILTLRSEYQEILKNNHQNIDDLIQHIKNHKIAPKE